MRLTDDQIKMARITYTKVVQDDFILDLIDTIEALQQEIEKLKATLADWKYNAKCDAEQMKYLLRRTLPILEVANDQQELIDAINALLGGKEDEK